jgi:hypothetical protein
MPADRPRHWLDPQSGRIGGALLRAFQPYVPAAATPASRDDESELRSGTEPHDPVSGIEPLYSEIQAAKTLTIKPRSLRTERIAGRISYKLVAGKVMYRHADLIAWQQKVLSCQEAEPTGPKARPS